MLENIVADTGSDNELPVEVIALPQDLEDVETKPYLISFENYNERECQIKDMLKNQPKKALEIFKLIGTKILAESDFSKFGITSKPIRNEGEYLKLWKGLSPDVEIKELIVQSESRIFYHVIEAVKKFYVVAITATHFETEKVRR